MGERERCKCRELLEFRRGEIEAIRLNPRSAKRKLEVDIGEVERRIDNEGNEIPVLLEMGRPKKWDKRRYINSESSTWDLKVRRGVIGVGRMIIPEYRRGKQEIPQKEFDYDGAAQSRCEWVWAQRFSKVLRNSGGEVREMYIGIGERRPGSIIIENGRRRRIDE